MNKTRNRLIAYALCIVVAVGALEVYGAVDSGTITTTIKSSTSARIQITELATELDSLYICWFAGTASDTTFAALMDTTQTDTTVTDLMPNTQYIVFLLSRDEGATAISDKDTVHTYPIGLGDPNREGFLNRKMATAASWRPTGSMDYVFDLDDIGALDSTLVYYAKTYNGLDVYATQAGDSCVAGVYFFPVNWTGGLNDYTNWHKGATIADSVHISGPGLTRETLSLPVGRYYIARIVTHTGNGKDADYILTLTSDGHN